MLQKQLLYAILTIKTYIKTETRGDKECKKAIEHKNAALAKYTKYEMKFCGKILKVEKLINLGENC